MNHKQTNKNCTHYMTPGCPERNNESMMKFNLPNGVIPSDKALFSDSDLKIIEKICANCPKYAPLRS